MIQKHKCYLQQVRAATVSAVGAVNPVGAVGAGGTATFAHTVAAPHHAAANIAHHPVTVNY